MYSSSSSEIIVNASASSKRFSIDLARCLAIYTSGINWSGGAGRSEHQKANFQTTS
jgi:hypothetical protein